MSVVIIGGNECMKNKYKEICKSYECKAKFFPKMETGLKDKIGTPDLMILFTSTVSHKLVRCAVSEAGKKNVTVERCHTSSASALKNLLSQYA